MLVVKLGGSLLQSNGLKQWLELIDEHGRGQCVVVTGGGMFADFIRDAQRQWQFDDHAAHLMSMSAMEQFAYYCQSLFQDWVTVRTFSEIQQCLVDQRVPIILPTSLFEDTDLLHADWTVTADSIAACLANHLDADALVLIKSISHALENNPQNLAAAGIVDRAFPQYCRATRYAFYCLAANQTNEFISLLN